MGFRDELALFASFTPALTSDGTQPVMAASGRVGRWVERDGLVVTRMTLTWAAGDTLGTGTYHVSLPTAARGGFLDHMGGAVFQGGGRQWIGAALLLDATHLFMFVEGNFACGAAAPTVPAIGNHYTLDLVYEAG